jgi:hypothetical protein
MSQLSKTICAATIIGTIGLTTIGPADAYYWRPYGGYYHYHRGAGAAIALGLLGGWP